MDLDDNDDDFNDGDGDALELVMSLLWRYGILRKFFSSGDW